MSLAAGAVDLAAIAATTVVASLAGGPATPATAAIAFGPLALLGLGVALARGDYAVLALLSPRGPLARVFSAWALAIAGMAALAVLTGRLAEDGRIADGLALTAGVALALSGRAAVAARARVWAAEGRLSAGRIMLVGTDAEVAAFLSRHDLARHGLRLVAATTLRPTTEALADDLVLACATARLRRPDDILVLMPWGEDALIEASVTALRRLPAAIHLGPTDLLDRYGERSPERPFGGLRLIRRPLSRRDLTLKRSFDIVVAGLALLVLSPVLAAIALAIKLDTSGPVFFRQRRTGFNQQPFRIFKFRSMSTLEDSAALRQVTDNDTRVTRVGRILRTTSLDELPQLINVLVGDMSLIGPRPHALAHDRAFGETHALYECRHNVRPGITGWAQVSGFRGETDTLDKIVGRVRHDLHYIDNWSIWLDLRIMLRTVFSRQTFRNAK